MRKLTLLFTIFINLSAFGSLCQDWSLQDFFAEIDSDIVYESSGISSSYDFPGERFYHINDSGSGASFHISYTDKDKELDSLLVKGASAEDLEALDVGPCLESDKKGEYEGCVYLGDIGDNDYERNNLKIFILAEKKSYKHGAAKFKLQLNVKYEDGHHNAEALMVHPVSGDIYIITKRSDPDFKVADDIRPRVYLLKREDFLYTQKGDELDVTLKYVGSLPIQSFVQYQTKKEYLVTDADFSPKGDKFVLLTLGGILEFNSEILNPNYQMSSQDLHYISNAPVLSQQEAISYTSDGKSLIYTSEKKNKKDKKGKTEIFKLNCRN